MISQVPLYDAIFGTNAPQPKSVSETPPSSPQQAQCHTRAASLLMGVHVPRNATRANSTSLRALARFVTSAPWFKGQAFREKHDEQGLDLHGKEERLAWELEATRKQIFPEGQGGWLSEGYTEWTQEQLENVRFYMIEFVVNYRKEKGQAEVKPGKMKGYILGIQRSFDADWVYALKLLE